MRYNLRLVFLVIFFFSTQSMAENVEQKLTAAASGKHRSQGNIDRNAFRHPVETLSWLGIKGDMTVVEISPGGGGWYTEALAPFLREKGVYYVANYNAESESEYIRKNSKKFRTSTNIR